MLNKRFDIKPFEDVSKLEHICNKNDCGLFIFGYFFIFCKNDIKSSTSKFFHQKFSSKKKTKQYNFWKSV